jgi:Mg2+-importing ATPase
LISNLPFSDGNFKHKFWGFFMALFTKEKKVFSQLTKPADELVKCSGLDIDSLFEEYETSVQGLFDLEVDLRQDEFGKNIAVLEKKFTAGMRFWHTISNPLVLLLLGLAIVSYFMEQYNSMAMMLIMVVLGVVLKFIQEVRADKAADKLKSMVSTTATVLREGDNIELPLSELVPGDLIKFSAGDIVPADVRLVQAKDLFINQATLTGEALPVEKFAKRIKEPSKNPLELGNICFLGTNIESGTAIAMVVNTGARTYFGSIAKSLARTETKSSFDEGMNKFTFLMISLMLVLVPLVFLVNWLTKLGSGSGILLQALLFSLSIAVGLTPEMLPMIVTVNLSAGAIAMSKSKVIVKKLSSIQNFGAMDVLCTDKTGTITLGKVVLEKHIDVYGDESEEVLNYGFLNSYYQTGLKSMMDMAILEHREVMSDLRVKEHFKKVDEIPFDFVRRKMSVVVEDNKQRHILICKGAVEEIMASCSSISEESVIEVLDDEHFASAKEVVTKLNSEGFRVLGLAYKEMPKGELKYSLEDEKDLILLGFLAFLDPPKESASEAISKLISGGIAVKILTGDNDLVTKKICQEVGLPVQKIMLGNDIETMSDEELAVKVEEISVFAKLAPAHKERIIRALKSRNHVVGFMGDGINDAPALKAADVGISVDTAVDIAKESSDIILLEGDLLVLEKGVIHGRRVFGNIIKYIKMAASSNFGNMFSVLGASAFLPFIPMLPMQLLTNNLLYDFSQVPIPTDSVDQEWLSKPRKWSIGSVRRFILFIGPISSIFDYCTFFIMMFIFGAWDNPALFRTGWFVESLLTQTLIIHVIRTNKIPFIQSRASLPLTLTSIAIVGVGIYIVHSPIGKFLEFVPLPLLYWPLLAVMMVCYILLTQYVKTWFVHRFGND